MALPFPCVIVSHSVAAPVAHSVVRLAKGSIHPIHRLWAHKIWHGFHAAASHPRLVLEIACRAAPFVVVPAMFALPLPIKPLPAPIAHSAMTADRPPSEGRLSDMPTGFFDFWPHGISEASPGQDTAAGNLLRVSLADAPLPLNFIPPLDQGAPSSPEQAYPVGDTGAQPPDTAVPEPSSLAVLVSALAGLRLLSRGRTSRL